MRSKADKGTFGRHETFALRYSWLSKGFQAVQNYPGVFDSENSTVELGVGKNMVTSIRYWLKAFQLIEKSSNTPTLLGKKLFDPKHGYDPYLEDEGTLWLLHWLLATNAEQATTFYWFFNQFHKSEFAAAELLTGLTSFVEVGLKIKVSPTTLKNDLAVLTRMYVQSKNNGRAPLEDALDSPLSLLGLLTHSPNGRTYQSPAKARTYLPTGIFSFAVAQLMQARGMTSLPLEKLMYSRDQFVSPGTIFRLTEADLIAKLEHMTEYMPNQFTINETAGIHQLYRLVENEVDPLQYLGQHYLINSKRCAAA
ncbi:MAG: DUF4007 family protein [Gammaproteobacteria bacterium]|nr:DUF4007 family protein [Gammaproteobacteria bacterium]